MIGKLVSGKYEILEELGHGGMGRVYKVYHRGLDQEFALKVLRERLAGEERLVGRFQDEARIMAQLRHPNIVRVFDIDKDGENYYFVMDYIEGDTLDTLIERQGAFSIAETIRISNEIGQALIYAHSRKPAVVHRDIKPSNVLLERRGGRVIVTDFGIAKIMDRDRTTLTQTGIMIGTLGYASPEQLRSDRALDGRADIFSFGMVIYEMLAGKRFFDDISAEEIIGMKLFDPRELIPQFEQQIPEHFRQVVTRAIAKDREQRYQSVEELITALNAAEGKEDGAAKAVSPTGTSAWPLLWISAVAAVVIVGGWLWFRYQPRSPQAIPVETGVALDAATRDANQPPVLIAWKPDSDRIAVHVGQQVHFFIDAVDIEEDPALSYRWFIDERLVSDEPGWRFVVDSDALGERIVEASVTDSQGATAERGWRVEVTAAEHAPPLAVDSAKQTPPAQACESIDETEVYAWLEQYRQALEGRDIDTLARLGTFYAPGELARLQSRERYESLIQDIDAVVGETEVRLKFEQVDRWYDARSYSTIVDYVSRHLVLSRQNCERLVARPE